MLHLRRIFTHKNKQDQQQQQTNQSSLILLDTYVKFGRNPELCDVILTSITSLPTTNMISRDHADITGIKTASGRYERYYIHDHSLNGTYINDRRCPKKQKTEIHPGDIIKFGHMNGASIKEGQDAPQANAEFAFVVEMAATAHYNYLGFRDGRRVKQVLCRGDVDSCTEGGDLRPNELRTAAASGSVTQPTTTSTTTTTAPTVSPANPLNSFFPYGQNMPLYSYPNFFPQLQWMQNMNMQNMPGFRSNVFSGTSNPLLNPATTSSLFQRIPGGIPGILNANSVAELAAHVASTTASQTAQQPLTTSLPPKEEPITLVENHQTPAARESVLKTDPVKPLVASPPMECDSSVPSPPKQTVAVVGSEKSEQKETKEEDQRSVSDHSAPESPPRRITAASLWDSTPSPAPRRETPDRESEVSRDSTFKEKEKEAKKDKPAVHRVRKNNELAGLLEDLTEGSWVNTVRRVSAGSRRATEEAAEKERSREKEKERERKKESHRRSSTSTKPEIKKEKDQKVDGKREKEKPKEREKEKESRPIKPMSVVGTPPFSSHAAKSAVVRKMKQLSDEDEASSDEDDIPVKKSAQKRKPKPQRDTSSEEDSDDDSDDSSRPKEKRHKKKKSKAAAKKARKHEPSISGLDDVDSDEVVIHDPTTTCGLNKQCTKPQDEQVNWICCDDCDTWYHNICILGHEDPPNTKHFYCGCVRRTESKLKKKVKR